MKRFIILVSIVGLTISAYAQTNLSAGLGFISGSQSDPGLVLEFEHEKFYTENFSLPLRGDIVMVSHPDYNALSFEIHKGFRKYSEKGFFAEQSIGLGVISMSNKTGNAWYKDEYGHVILYGDGPAWGLMPSVTLGGGYKLTTKKESQYLIWVRPKIYWNLAGLKIRIPIKRLPGFFVGGARHPVSDNLAFWIEEHKCGNSLDLIILDHLALPGIFA